MTKKYYKVIFLFSTAADRGFSTAAADADAVECGGKSE